MTDLKQEKQTMREQARLHRDRLDVDESIYESVIDVFFDTIKPSKDQIVSLYWPVRKEFDTRFLLDELVNRCLLYTSPSPRDQRGSRMPSSA